MSNYIFKLNLTNIKRNRLIKTSEVYKSMFEFTLKKQITYYNKNNTFLKDNIIIKEVTQLKKEKEYTDLNKINAEIIIHAIHSATKYFIHCINNNKIPYRTKEPIRDLHFYTNAKRVKIDFNKNTIHIDKIKTLNFFEDDIFKNIKDKKLNLKSCKVYFDKNIKDWLISIDLETIQN